MKQDDQRDQVGSDLYAVLEASRWLAVLLAPIVPDLSSRMLVQLGQQPFNSDAPKESGPPSDQPADQPSDEPQGQSTWLAAQQWGVLQPGLALPEPEPVMRRLELDSPL
jgi:methionyl-tRNA synthetase